MTIEELFGTLQQSVVSTWRKHLRTAKYSKHMALDKFYNENTQHEINKEKKKKLKNKLKSELYNWYINENTFNAIKRGKYPTVTRENVFRICFGLRLSYEESKRLMSSAGHEFRRDEKLDCVVEAILVSEHPGRYDAKEIEATIYHYTGLSLLTIEN